MEAQGNAMVLQLLQARSGPQGPSGPASGSLGGPPMPGNTQPRSAEEVPPPLAGKARQASHTRSDDRIAVDSLQLQVAVRMGPHFAEAQSVSTRFSFMTTRLLEER